LVKSSRRRVSDYESICDVINWKHAAVGESGKSMTLPRCHVFKVPEVPVRKSSADGESRIFRLCLTTHLFTQAYAFLWELFVQECIRHWHCVWVHTRV